MKTTLSTTLACLALVATAFAQKEEKPPAEEKKPPQATIEVSVVSAAALKAGDESGASARITGKAVVTAESDLTASIHSLKFFLIDPAGKRLGEPPLVEKKKLLRLLDASLLKKGRSRTFNIELSLKDVAVEAGKKYVLVVRSYSARGRCPFQFTPAGEPAAKP